MLRILYLFSFLASHVEILPFFDSKILNEKDVKVGEIPYQVSLQYKDSSIHFCGGAILNENYVITAAHCVDDKSEDEIKVVAATVNLKFPKSQHNVAEIIIHEDYDLSNFWIHDIALLRVETPFKKSATVEYVPLPPKDYITKTDEAVVSGWGTLWEDGSNSNKLKRVNTFITGPTMCALIYKFLGQTIHPTHVCSYDLSYEKGICNGDSGGPLTVDGKLVGLVSWSSGCGTYPVVFTRVVSYLDWIKNNAI